MITASGIDYAPLITIPKIEFLGLTLNNEGSNIVVLDPDVAKIFHDREIVNESLRALVRIIRLKEKLARSRYFFT